MKMTNRISLVTIFLVLVASICLGQGQQKKTEETHAQTEKRPIAAQEPAAELEEPEDRGYVEFGGRGFFGDVYGRPDLPFKPNLSTSKLNEYSDIRNNFLIRRARIYLDNVLGTKYYLNYLSQSSFYRNQSHLVSFGQYNKFKLQIRYDEIPHTFTNTARTPYFATSPGVWTMPLALRQSLQTASSTGTAAQINNSLPSYMATQIVPYLQFYVPTLQRRAGSGLINYYLKPEWTLTGFYWREHMSGTRPIGSIFNSSPSASGSSQPSGVTNRQSPGTAVELPEPIDYFNNLVRAMTEYDRERWAVLLGYTGSFFEENIPAMVFDNPFATADVPVQIIPPGTSGCTGTSNCTIGAVSAHGQRALYPSNHANYINFATNISLGKRTHVMGMVSPGWLRQNAPFLPYTANGAITGLAALPAASLNGDKQTLAMNWTAVSKITHNIELEAKYRQYDYNNNTRVLQLTPIEGDTIGANSTGTGQASPSLSLTDTDRRSNPGYNRRTLDVAGNWYFLKRSSLDLGWEGEWFDRSHRDVEHSYENTFFGDVDFSPNRDWLLRVSGRHQDRTPDVYQDDEASDPNTGAPIACTSTSTVFTAEQRCHRRFDEAARTLDRGDAMLQYNMQQWTFTGSFQTIQQDFNRSGGSNSPVPLNFVPGATNPYFLYGSLKDLSWIYAADASYAFSADLSAFVEYTHEDYHKRMISRSRTPTSGTQTILTCNGCDTANNDWESIYRDNFETYAGGLDVFLHKRFWISPYYSLAAGQGHVSSRALGNPGITTGPNDFTLTGTSTPENYPDTTTRIHELAVVFKYKLTSHLMPKFEYRYQQFDSRDYQTTPMTPYMGCIGAGSIVVQPPCVNVGSTVAAKAPSPYYPYFVVGDTAAARYLFLGADQPSYHAHVFTGTLEYHF
jgi:hypothetical protein